MAQNFTELFGAWSCMVHTQLHSRSWLHALRYTYMRSYFLDSAIKFFAILRFLWRSEECSVNMALLPNVRTNFMMKNSAV